VKGPAADATDSPLIVQDEEKDVFSYFSKSWSTSVGRNSVDGIATRYELDGPGIESRWGARFSASIQTGPGAYPASCTMGTWSFPG
jgi:hypothetical protein